MKDDADARPDYAAASLNSYDCVADGQQGHALILDFGISPTCQECVHGLSSLFGWVCVLVGLAVDGRMYYLVTSKKDSVAIARPFPTQLQRQKAEVARLF